jgi:hypothetical protein
VSEPLVAPPPGAGLVNATFVGTGLVVGTSIAAALAPDTFGLVHAVVSCALFAIGTGGILWGYALGVSRSRDEAVSIPGLFFLGGGAGPPEVRRPFLVALAVEIVAVVAAAAIRPYSEVAFGILAPMFALGLMSTWAGRHGRFPARAPHESAPRQRAAASAIDTPEERAR